MRFITELAKERVLNPLEALKLGFNT